MTNSRVMILGICSNHKEEGGDSAYNPEAAISSMLPPQDASQLISRRQQAYHLIQDAIRGGVHIDNHVYNRGLGKGRDFGGDAVNVSYLPAIVRYDGRFFRAMKADLATRKSLVENSPHHFLLLSSLYGLVNALEPIQCYSLHVSDHERARTIWLKGELTSTILSYMRQYSISRVFDFTAMNVYRSLVNWGVIRNWASDGVFHVFSKRNAGANALQEFGQVVASYLTKGENDLLSIRARRPEESQDDEIIVLSASDTTPSGCPQEDPDYKPLDTSGFPEPPKAERSVSSASRPDIPFHSSKHGAHGTIWGHQVHKLSDIPADARGPFLEISRVDTVLGVYLGRRDANGRCPRPQIRFLRPSGSGSIVGALSVPGGTQYFEIRVASDLEAWTCNSLKPLLAEWLVK